VYASGSNTQNVFTVKQIITNQQGMSTDNYGYFGPAYSFADNIPLPGEIGVRQESSIGAIIDAVGGINHYVNVIAFGQRSFMDTRDQKPMGLRYFLNTGMRCSNGATMSEYVNGVTRGDAVGSRISNGLASAGLPQLRGLAPGILENAQDALDPRPIFSAVSGTGYPVCQKVACAVGDDKKGGQQYLVDPVDYKSGIDGPVQVRWVQAYDKTGAPISITADEFASQPKCYNADGTYMDRPPSGCPPTEPPEESTPLNEFGGLCRRLQAPVLPQPLQEGFQGLGQDQDTQILLGIAGLVCIGIGVWGVLRQK